MFKNRWTCLLAGLGLACSDGPTAPHADGIPEVSPQVAAAKSAGIQAGNNQAALVGAATPSGLAVWVMDADGKVVSGVPVTFQVTGGGGSIADANSATTSVGVASSGKWTLGQVGTNTVVAHVEGTNLSVTFNATGTTIPPTAPAAIGIQAGSGQTALAGTTTPNGLAVWVKDAQGHVIPGIPVTFSVTSGGGSIADARSATTSVGVASSGKWTLGQAGLNTAIARIDGTSITVAFTATATAPPVIAPASAGIQAGNGQTAIAGTQTPNGLAIWVRDANGNTIAGVPVTFSVTGGGGSIADGSSVTTSAGVASSGKWTLGATPGTNTVQAKVNGYNISVAFTATGTAPPVQSAVPSSISVTSGNGQSAPAGRGIRNDISLLVKDQNGNPFPNASVTLTAGNGGSVSPAVVYTNSAGVAVVRGWTLGGLTGAQSISARVSTGTVNPVVGISSTATTMRIVTFGDSNTDRGYAGTSATFKAVSYVSMDGPRPSAGAPNDATQLAGKIEAQWRSRFSAAVAAINHAIASTTSGSNRQGTGAPGALTVVNGVTRYDAEMLGIGTPWNGGEPVNTYYSGAIVRSRSFAPTVSSDFGYISIGTNDQTNGITPAQTLLNLTTMIDKWIARGLPANHLIITTLAPAPGVGAANIPALNASIRTLAAQKGVKLVDISSYVSANDGLTWKSTALYVPDGTDVHYSETVRDWIATQVVSLVEAATSPR